MSEALDGPQDQRMAVAVQCKASPQGKLSCKPLLQDIAALATLNAYSRT
jgi:hypothetical protein